MVSSTRPTFYPVIRGERWVLRVEDLEPTDYISVECAGCGNIGFIRGDWLQDRCAGHRRLLDLAPDFRCVRCGPGKPVQWSVYAVNADPEIDF